jgi:hypothetical protein
MPQQNDSHTNVSEVKRRSTQSDAATRPGTFDSFGGKNRQHAKQNKKNRCGAQESRQRRSYKRRKEKDGFQLDFRMFMLPFKRMRVYNDNPIYHMRVGKQSQSSPIGYE